MSRIWSFCQRLSLYTRAVSLEGIPSDQALISSNQTTNKSVRKPLTTRRVINIQKKWAGD
jgi:hypothetical protein